MPDQGIDAYAAYLPAYVLTDNRLDADGPAGPGDPVRSVAGFDEDVVTMAVEALRHILPRLRGDRCSWPRRARPTRRRPPPGSCTRPSAWTPASAPPTCAGTGPGRPRWTWWCGPAASPPRPTCRTTRPGAPDELGQGDAAAAFAGGGARAAVLLGRAGHTTEILDRWRLPGERHDRVWDERFTAEILAAAGLDAARRALAEASLDAVDHVVVASSNPRAAAALRKRLRGAGQTPPWSGPPASPAPPTPGCCSPRPSTTPNPARRSCCCRRPRAPTRSCSGSATGSARPAPGRPVREQLAAPAAPRLRPVPALARAARRAGTGPAGGTRTGGAADAPPGRLEVPP